MPSTSSLSRHSSSTNHFDDEYDESNDNVNDDEFDIANLNVSDEKQPASNNKNKGRKNSNNGKIMAAPPKARLKNVDRNDVQVEEVTVNNITVVITEFKPKRNGKYNHNNTIENTSPQKSEASTNKKDSISNKEQKSKENRKSNNNSASNPDGKSTKSSASKKRTSAEMNDLNHSATKRITVANAD